MQLPTSQSATAWQQLGAPQNHLLASLRRKDLARSRPLTSPWRAMPRGQSWLSPMSTGRFSCTRTGSGSQEGG